MKAGTLKRIGRDAYTVDGCGKTTRYSRIVVPPSGGLGEGDKVEVFIAERMANYPLEPGDVVIRKV